MAPCIPCLTGGKAEAPEVVSGSFVEKGVPTVTVRIPLRSFGNKAKVKE